MLIEDTQAERSAVTTLTRFVHDDPHRIAGWNDASPGRHRLATELNSALEDRGVVLHDRVLSGTQVRVDHLVVAPTGVWVIDARDDLARIEFHDQGTRLHPDRRLYVGGRDDTSAAADLASKVAAVRRALEPSGFGGAPVTAAVCFTDADFALRAEPFRVAGAWVTWSRRLADLVLEQQLFSDEAILIVGDQLAESLLPGV